jgi:hypothetical protein
MGDDGPMEDQTTPRGWAVPGSAEDQPSPAPLPPLAPGAPAAPGVVHDAGAGTGAPGAGGPAAGTIPRVALRPMTVADILDGGFAVVKARPRRILGIAALFVVPTHLLVAYLQRDLLGAFSLSGLVTDDPTLLNEDVNSDSQVLALVLGLLVPAVALVCVAAAIAHLVGQWTMGRDASAGEMLGVVGRRLWPLLGSFVLVKLAEAVGSACYIGFVFVMALFVPVAPIIGVEGTGPAKALGRSIRLVRARYFPVLGIALLMALVSVLLATALSALPEVLAAWIGSDRAWPLVALGSIASEIVVMPWVAAATVLLYFDLRVRTEGFDLELAAIDLLDRGA